MYAEIHVVSDDAKSETGKTTRFPEKQGGPIKEIVYIPEFLTSLKVRASCRDVPPERGNEFNLANRKFTLELTKHEIKEIAETALDYNILNLEEFDKVKRLQHQLEKEKAENELLREKIAKILALLNES